MRTQDQSECQPTFHRTGPIDTMVAKNVKAGLILGSTVIDTTWTRPLVEPVDDAATVELLSIGNLRMRTARMSTRSIAEYHAHIFGAQYA